MRYNPNLSQRTLTKIFRNHLITSYAIRVVFTAISWKLLNALANNVYKNCFERNEIPRAEIKAKSGTQDDIAFSILIDALTENCRSFFG